MVTIKFCTCHESYAVVARAKFCSDMITYNWVILKPIFHRIWITMKNSFVKWALCDRCKYVIRMMKWLHNHSKTKHIGTVCILYGIFCMCVCVPILWVILYDICLCVCICMYRNIKKNTCITHIVILDHVCLSSFLGLTVKTKKNKNKIQIQKWNGSRPGTRLYFWTRRKIPAMGDYISYITPSRRKMSSISYRRSVHQKEFRGFLLSVFYIYFFSVFLWFYYQFTMHSHDACNNFLRVGFTSAAAAKQLDECGLTMNNST